jgi:hypothetical protein
LQQICLMDDSGERTGFNAAVAGCFFALESVLRSSTTDTVPSLTTAMLLLSSVLASVVSQAGLGSDPAFKIPAYDFRSPAGKQSTQFCILQNCTISYPHKLLAASMTALLTMLCRLSRLANIMTQSSLPIPLRNVTETQDGDVICFALVSNHNRDLSCSHVGLQSFHCTCCLESCLEVYLWPLSRVVHMQLPCLTT